jgi:PR domain zinc finger protein 5
VDFKLQLKSDQAKIKSIVTMPKTKQKKITSFFNSQASSVIKEEVEEQQQQQVYECGDCGDIFDTQEFAMDHQKKDCVKLKKKKHAEAFCDLCQLNFASKYSLKAHIKSKHDENPKNFACSFCEKAFATKGQLTVHLRSHTKEKVFKCTVCEKAFSHRESLITHATTHTGIKVRLTSK